MSRSSSENMEWWREYLGGTSVHLFEVINRAIDLAMADYPDQFVLHRDRIAQRLFSSICSSNTADAGGRKVSAPLISEEEDPPREVLTNKTGVAAESEGVSALSNKVTISGSTEIHTAESKVGAGVVEGRTRSKITIKCQVLTEGPEGGDNINMREKQESDQRRGLIRESRKSVDGDRIQGIRTPLPSEGAYRGLGKDGMKVARRIEFKAESLKGEAVVDRIDPAKIAKLQGSKVVNGAARKIFNSAQRRPDNVAAAKLEKIRVESKTEGAMKREAAVIVGAAERRLNINRVQVQKTRLDDTKFERILDGKTKLHSNVEAVKERLEGSKRKLKEAYDRADLAKRVKRTQVLDYSEAVKLQKKSSCSEELRKRKEQHLGKMMHVPQQRV